MDLLGERWAMLVARELMFGPQRFSGLRASLPGISAKILTQRLAGLEAAGVVVRRRLPPPASAQVYALTDWGREIEPILQALGRWAARSPLHDPTLPFSATSLMLSLRTMFDPTRARWLSARIGFRIGDEIYRAILEDGRLAIARSEDAGADATFVGAAPAIAALIYGGVRLDVLEADGALRIEGERALARRFAGLFPLPEKVAPVPPAS